MKKALFYYIYLAKLLFGFILRYKCYTMWRCTDPQTKFMNKAFHSQQREGLCTKYEDY